MTPESQQWFKQLERLRTQAVKICRPAANKKELQKKKEEEDRIKEEVAKKAAELGLRVTFNKDDSGPSKDSKNSRDSNKSQRFNKSGKIDATGAGAAPKPSTSATKSKPVIPRIQAPPKDDPKPVPASKTPANKPKSALKEPSGLHGKPNGKSVSFPETASSTSAPTSSSSEGTATAASENEALSLEAQQKIDKGRLTRESATNPSSIG